MIACPNCSTQNTLDSLFCRRCGAGFSEDLLKEEQAKLEASVAKGMDLLHDGEVSEAFVIAEASILTNPAYPLGYALKGMAHEKRGELAQALDCYETVVSLNPDSAIDRIKLNQLRTVIQNRANQTPEPDRRTAALIAVASVILFAGIGWGLVELSKAGKSETVSTGAGDRFAQNGPYNPGLGVNPGVVQPNQTGVDPAGKVPQNGANQTNSQPNPGDVPPVRNGQQDRGNGQRTGFPGNIPRPTMTGELPPAPVDFSGPIQGDVNTNQGNGSQAANQGNSGRNTNPVNPPVVDPRRDGGRDEDPEPDINQKSRKDPGRIEIVPSAGQNTGPAIPGGGAVVTDRDPVPSNNDGRGQENYRRIGDQQYQSGNLENAAKSYEQALAGGGDRASISMRLGDVYKRLRRTADAANAYRNAIEAYEDRLKRGVGDAEQTKQTLTRLRSSLKSVGG
jgi:tetratricopeptide (TPR) repeat protein